MPQTLRSWRLVKRKHQKGAFTGEGARLHGGRWNSPGTRIVYTAESQALASLEVMVNLEAQELLFHYLIFEVTFPSSLVAEVKSPLPKGWDAEPALRKVALIGDKWCGNRTSAILRVPSAVIPSEYNYLINPAHTHVDRIKLGKPAPFRVHPRFQQKFK